MKPHRHLWRVSTAFGIMHAVCTRCSKVTFHPWWPMWKARE